MKQEDRFKLNLMIFCKLKKDKKLKFSPLIQLKIKKKEESYSISSPLNVPAIKANLFKDFLLFFSSIFSICFFFLERDFLIIFLI